MYFFTAVCIQNTLSLLEFDLAVHTLAKVSLSELSMQVICIQHTKYPIVARALGLVAAECALEQRYLAYNQAIHARQYCIFYTT